MSRSTRNISIATSAIATSASALAMLALSGAAGAQEPADQGYDTDADTQMESTMEGHSTTESTPGSTPGSTTESTTDSSTYSTTGATAAGQAGQAGDEMQQMAATLGVSDLNELEDWKITNAGTELGEIDRIGVDRATGEVLAVVALEGVVGVNMKEVAIPLTSLEKAGEETLSSNLSKEELQKQRDIDPWDGSYSQVLKENATQ
jgi:hypothetical protein